MKKSLRALLLSVLLLGVLPLWSQPAQAQSGRQVYAFYFGWWTGDSWNDGRLSDRPQVPYSSWDGAAIARQIDQARSAGIDAFIMSWFGPKNNNLTHQSFNILLDQASARGFKAGAALDMQEGGYNASTGEVIESLTYLISDRAQHPAYLRFNGKPVIYFWNQKRFSVGDWQYIRNQVDPNRDTIWVAEGTDTSFIPTFDGLYLFNTAWSSNPAATAQQYLAATQAAGGWWYTPTVLPGWDESALAGRTNPTDPQDRGGAQFLVNSWNGAISSGAGVILIVSWNEYFENSHIEPSQVHGTLALDTLRSLIAAWKGTTPPPAPAAQPVQSFPEGTPVLTPSVSLLNVRSGPGTENALIGSMESGQQFAVTGEQGGWYSVDYNGQTGWVSGEYAIVTGGAVASSGGGTSSGSNALGTPTGVQATTRNILNFRSAPGQSSTIYEFIPFQTALDVVGRSADSQWIKVNFNGRSGWIAAEYANLSGDLNSAPVTD
ncbi:MAG: SH3 domain-containing protein [Anaerolineae bacterium]|nr:SH3 domain-containing protein [Anaerolineae bacterium]